MRRTIIATVAAALLTAALPVEAQSAPRLTKASAAKRLTLAVQNAGGKGIQARCRAPKRGSVRCSVVYTSRGGRMCADTRVTVSRSSARRLRLRGFKPTCSAPAKAPVPAPAAAPAPAPTPADPSPPVTPAPVEPAAPPAGVASAPAPPAGDAPTTAPTGFPAFPAFSGAGAQPAARAARVNSYTWLGWTPYFWGGDRYWIFAKWSYVGAACNFYAEYVWAYWWNGYQWVFWRDAYFDNVDGLGMVTYDGPVC